MGRFLTVRFVVLAVLLAALIRAAVTRGENLGAIEWLVLSLLALVLVIALVRAPRRAA